MDDGAWLFRFRFIDLICCKLCVNCVFLTCFYLPLISVSVVVSNSVEVDASSSIGPVVGGGCDKEGEHAKQLLQPMHFPMLFMHCH